MAFVVHRMCALNALDVCVCVCMSYADNLWCNGNTGRPFFVDIHSYCTVVHITRYKWTYRSRTILLYQKKADQHNGNDGNGADGFWIVAGITHNMKLSVIGVILFHFSVGMSARVKHGSAKVPPVHKFYDFFFLSCSRFLLYGFHTSSSNMVPFSMALMLYIEPWCAYSIPQLLIPVNC